jgi:hypothetical protein
VLLWERYYWSENWDDTYEHWRQSACKKGMKCSKRASRESIERTRRESACRKRGQTQQRQATGGSLSSYYINFRPAQNPATVITFNTLNFLIWEKGKEFLAKQRADTCLQKEGVKTTRRRSVLSRVLQYKAMRAKGSSMGMSRTDWAGGGSGRAPIA